MTAGAFVRRLDFVARGRRLWRDVAEIRRFVADTHDVGGAVAAGGMRKSPTRVVADLVAWRLRHGEVNRYYYCWGLDRRPATQRDLISYTRFRTRRDALNRVPVGAGRSNYTLLLDDKHLFSLFLESLGHPTPPIVAIADRHAITWLAPRRTLPLASIVDAARDVDVFCKEVLGEQGTNVFRLQVAAGAIAIDGRPATLDDLAARLRSRHLLQQRVVQHPALAALYPASINTLRIVTVRDGATVRHFSMPVLRTGVGGGVVDNWIAGGLLVVVDAATGRLRGPGRSIRGVVHERHPDTGVVFDGHAIPHFDASLQLCLRLHGDIPELHSIGWDIAITADGPTVIEGNHNWSGALRIGLDPDFKRNFQRLFPAA